MIVYLLSFVGGVWLFQYQPRIPDPTLFAVYLSLGVLALWTRWLRWPVWLVAGFAWAHGHALLTRPEPLPPMATQGPVWATGRIASLVHSSAGRTRFVMTVDRLAQDGRAVAGHWPLRVTWYRDSPKILPGETWRLLLRIRPAEGYSNPGGFDYARWLYQQGIGHTASVRRNNGNGRVSPVRGFWLARARQRLSDAIAALGGGPSAALLRALVVGDREGFGSADWRVFTATGTNHLVAISGLHIGLVAGLVGFAAGGVWRRLPVLCARVPAMHAAVVRGTLAALVYAALAGFSIPTQRALLMLAVAGVAWLGGRGRQPARVLALALAVVVAWQPVAVLSPGLWLSFVAVAAILWVMLPAHGSGKLRRWVTLQLALGAALLPLLLLFFGQASLSAPLVNLLAIPWFSLLLVPLALLASLLWVAMPAAGDALWRVWLGLGQWTFDALRIAAHWDWALLTHPVSHAGLLPLAAAGVLLLLAPRGMPGRWLGLVLVLPLATRQPPTPAPGTFTLTMLDVGQGLALVVRTHDHVLVYDAGPRFRSGFNSGAAVVLPYLRENSIGRIDALIASHSDIDHAGGIPALRDALPVARLLSGEPSLVAGASACVTGQRWRWDGVTFTVLSPPVGTPPVGNNASCVLRVSNGVHDLLLTGDIEAEVERRLLADAELAPTDVVVVPHHGSLSSSTTGFVRELAPIRVLYATGRDNRWGFPKATVVARWREQGASSWDTARDGAVTVNFPASGRPIRVRGARRHHYWQP